MKHQTNRDFTLKVKTMESTLELRTFFKSKNIEYITLNEVYNSSFKEELEDIIFLPLYPTLSKNDLNKILSIIKQYV